MSYSTNYLDQRCTLLLEENFSDAKGQRVRYAEGDTIWCGLQFTKGGRALRAGELQAYESALFRSRWRADIADGTRILCGGKFYNLSAVHADYRGNTVQAVATEIKPFKFTAKNAAHRL